MRDVVDMSDDPPGGIMTSEVVSSWGIPWWHINEAKDEDLVFNFGDWGMRGNTPLGVPGRRYLGECSASRLRVASEKLSWVGAYDKEWSISRAAHPGGGGRVSTQPSKGT